jgi:hypothetical protein
MSCGPLPVWELRLAIFLKSSQAPWPLQWLRGKGVACVRCGDAIGEGTSKPWARGVPACKACRPAVVAVCEGFAPNDWTKRFRRVKRVAAEAAK